MDSTVRTFQVFGLTSSLVLAGINLGSSHLTVPLLYNQPTSINTPFFKDFYTRGAVTLVPLALFSGASSGIVAYLVPAQRTLWAVAAVATVSQLPWTVLGMMATNNRLNNIATSSVEQEKVGRDEVVALLEKWRWMNIVRGLLAFTGGLSAILALQNE
ncbi:hypothetical protein NOF04DRAFT_15453 [Fusarium oxysporum II5]|uniref:Noranthrone monooxygenase n=3 Tax=Fusarium oxysporum species complex TaxID=171631 RepID=N1RQS0_FUSC4|nr:uncharacterized protein FOIG_03707 [Fusarium odoratissimum NRRL 54006]EMT68154.1 hypothetical protein FOC4_g10012564 [Fusarium odoratissimum]EXM07143.1 hypothetical protein FOIG_03707 [Fusarium odoratissimum NRRL 54006]KAK2132529.1 hypothetical protein NOF04DRAFT_15453 [Fusarium oxysporum II5]TXC08819.1 hypothetical protein FocTR4_00002662 [Fusarium oxysporum f. sp. cubense]